MLDIMKNIYKFFAALSMAGVILASCEEWEPVFTFDYGEADVYEPVQMTANTTIAELKALYKNAPVKIQTDMVIAGQVVSEDKSGNVYKSLYIQDETGGIELKLGKTGLYNDYKLGQWIYVKCNGLVIGAYSNMLQLGFEDKTGEYETSYLDVQYFIDNHIFRGRLDTPVAPKILTQASEVSLKENIGRFVTIKGLTYGNEVFCLIYIDPNAKDKSSTDNRIFLSDKTWGIDTWAMSKNGFVNYINAGTFDSAATNSGITVPQAKEQLIKNATAYAVSQYFTLGSKSVQVRTSGYARFADTKIDPRILSGAKVDITGILTTYNNEAQFTLIDIDGVKIAE